MLEHDYNTSDFLTNQLKNDYGSSKKNAKRIKKYMYIATDIWTENLYLTCTSTDFGVTFEVATIDIKSLYLGTVYLYLDGGIDVTSIPSVFQDEAYNVVYLFAEEQYATPYRKT